jgi:hypothetical protein
MEQIFPPTTTSTSTTTMAPLTITISRMWAHYILPLLMTIAIVTSLSPQSKGTSQKITTTTLSSSFVSPSNSNHKEPSRRAFLVTGLAAAVAFQATPAKADMPMVTADEFNIIMRDSARGITRVEFSGPKSDTVIVRLVDGTAFGIKDVIESSVDPRSPLKIAANCRENKVPTRFVDIEAVLSTTNKRRKKYTNSRVAEADRKEGEKKIRLQEDEENRLAELFRQEQQ